MKYDKSFGLSLSLEPCLMTSQNRGASIYAEELARGRIRHLRLRAEAMVHGKDEGKRVRNPLANS